MHRYEQLMKRQEYTEVLGVQESRMMTTTKGEGALWDASGPGLVWSQKGN